MPERFHRDMRPADMALRIGRPDPFIIECGSHEGQDTERFLEAFPECRLVCFEPDLRPIYRKHPPGFMERICYDSRVSLIHAAVTDEDGPVLLHGSSGDPPGECWEGVTDWDHSGSICRPTGHLKTSPWCTFPEDRQRTVPGVRLDSALIKHEGPIDFIWADIQGAEAKMIRGAPETLKRTRWLYTEFDDREQYEGQPNLAAIRTMLPDWELIATYNKNALFHNTIGE